MINVIKLKYGKMFILKIQMRVMVFNFTYV